ncbi:MAG: WecB/TagA/CpsF family glycosyltransferase [Leptolyngbyaceae cyanobacterium SM1_1_3]|nr:WecB/TagA/CpsF family glycosyltransferase [Leptolyngbyaceae cyanobacterium SM1_1_3]NJN02665.1 WecB/TagA/CpsF family glycosyltransferase [Leptolyngbyaceae cyanobacterium RM1_1_2]NJO11185.1 WecB/TagA/CpsF family glycosyltransferase [Leptolyngbyaceae cyanobacterium SL_1_1]
MINQGKHSVLGIEVSAIDYEAAVSQIMQAAVSGQPLTVSALAVHGVMTGVLDPEQGYRLNHLDLVVPDGQPVRWALNWLHQTQLSDRVYGPTLMLQVCDRAAQAGLPVYFYGSRPEVLEALIQNLQARFPRLPVVGSQPSYFRQVSTQEMSAIAATIQASGAKIVFAGLGCPRQEVWAYEYRDRLSMPILAIGAAFDFHAGRLSQAPGWMQKRGLEWLFRLSQEPGRLWQRYLLLNPLYLWLLLLQLLGLRPSTPTILPQQERRYG